MLLKDAIEIPATLGSEQFVLRLTEGVSDAQAQKTLDDYVITAPIARNLDLALGILQGALGISVEGGQIRQGPHAGGKAAYLHGSFGSGKSHFMAVLHLLLKGDPRALNRTEIAPVVAKYRPWLGTKKFLLVPYHMLGASTIEARVYEDYCRLVERLHPEGRPPSLFDSDSLIRDAEGLRTGLGDTAFFDLLAKGKGDKGWGKLAAEWDAGRYKAALAERPGSPQRQKLADTLVERVFPGASRSLGHIRFDEGLSRISEHAKGLGYDGIVLFLDELILWLASKAALPGFLEGEIDKIVNLVEAQRMNRPIPIVSFIARQRDLRDLIGRDSTGAQQLAIDDKLAHHEGRFAKIELSTAELPEIASKRLLQPRSPAGRQAIDNAFEQVQQLLRSASGAAVKETLLGDRGTLDAFRKVYPFSPALVDTLVAAASMLQRDRTALRAMLQLLVEQREHLEVGEIIPVGDLYDVIKNGTDAITPAFATKFENAQRFFEQRLVAILERDHKRSRRDIEILPWKDPARVKWRADERILKTVLLSHLVPSVPALQHLTPQRIAALNHGSITSIIPGQEAQLVLTRLRNWSVEVPELALTGEGNPQVSLALHGVDIESIVKNGASHDNHGNRVQLLKEILHGELCIEAGQLAELFPLVWRGTKRSARVLFRNIADMPLSSFENDGPDWLVVIDYPMDEDSSGAARDDARIAEFKARGKSAQTLLWRPTFLNQRTRDELGRLVRLERILRSEQSFEQAASHLSSEDRLQAKPLLDSQKRTLREKLVGTLMAAYGMSNDPAFKAGLDGAVSVADVFVSLDDSLTPKPPAAGKFRDGLERLLDQALVHQFPKAPLWEKAFSGADVRRALEIALKAAGNHPHRVDLDSTQARLMREFAVPLDLGRCTSAFELTDAWLNHFERQVARSKDPVATVRDLRRWTDEPEAQGLPKDVLDLLVIVYATQSERAFFRGGAPLQEGDARIGGLQPEDELRRVPMPSEADWKRAIEAAHVIFGVASAELFCNGPNVGSLASRVRALVRENRKTSQQLREALVQCTPDGLRRTSKRLKDANAVLDLFEQLDTDSPKDLIDRLAKARFDPEVTGESVAASWRQAQAVIEGLERVKWKLVEGLRTVEASDPRHEPAAALLAKLETALDAHQLAVPLPAVLRDVEDNAADLLIPKGVVKPPLQHDKPVVQPPVPPVVPPIDTTPPAEKEYVVVRTREELEQLAKQLGELVREGTTIEVSWVMRTEDR
ncbi:MAG: hypothetical protein ABL998_01075 [Planctomycetota bacterium]